MTEKGDLHMRNITTEAWVLYAGGPNKEPGKLVKEPFSFGEITEDEVLVEPLYGSWEGNMGHAIKRDPVDICRLRKEPKVVIGNSGVVRILRVGSAITSVKSGDLAVLFGGLWDKHGFLTLGNTYGYDAAGSIGMLTKQCKLRENQFLPLPKNTRHSLQAWAVFSLRYFTAYNNWNLAYQCFRLQMSEQDCPVPWVWGWGGGSTLAELELARSAGCKTAMMSSIPERLRYIEDRGILPIDRRQFPNLNYNEEQYRNDPAFKKAYDESERIFLNLVEKHTEGQGVSIFVDYIGAPVSVATQRALSRQGVLTTAGWKRGMKITSVRALECINRHIHAHTHYARYSDGLPAIALAESTGWLPKIGDKVWSWDEIPALAEDHAADRITDYFPVYQVNS